MLSFTGTGASIRGAFKLYRNTLSVTSTANVITDLTSWIQQNLPGLSKMKNIPPKVRRKLEILARRIAVISPLLNYCLLYSQSRSSCTADAVLQTKEVLKQVHVFLVECNKKGKLADSAYMCENLEEHVRELEFCTNSLSLALSIIQISKAGLASMHETREPSAGKEPELSLDEEKVGGSGDMSPRTTISLSCLIRASSRISERHHQGGDLCDVYGTLFLYEPKNRATPWVIKFQKAVLKVYRNRQRKVYELFAENAQSQSPTQLTPLDHGSLLPVKSAKGKEPLRWNLSSSLMFCTTSERLLGLEHPSNKNNDSTPLNNCFAWNELIANNVKKRYAFVIASDLAGWDKSETSSPQKDGLLKLSEPLPLGTRDPSSSTSGPLLFAYIARLCIYENDSPSPSFSAKPYKDVRNGQSATNHQSAPLHLLAGDEALELILRNPRPLSIAELGEVELVTPTELEENSRGHVTRTLGHDSDDQPTYQHRHHATAGGTTAVKPPPSEDFSSPASSVLLSPAKTSGASRKWNHFGGEEGSPHGTARGGKPRGTASEEATGERSSFGMLDFEVEEDSAAKLLEV